MSEVEVCPGCGLKLPASDHGAQVAHMEAEHPELIAERLRSAGFVEGSAGEWIDTLAADDA